MRDSALKVHFIAIGGSAMHSLAIALKRSGYIVTGSDDEIFEPSLTRLKNESILPATNGWFPEKITSELDCIVLGMHARKDNPELLKAKEIGLPIYSYPEFIYLQSLDKQRVVIAGSHGKTTITSMILHVMKFHHKKFDYMVGAQIEGFDNPVKITPDAPVIILEGDEYLSSPIDSQPKFLHYHHHIGLISGVAWDHINVFPTFDEYVQQFDAFADSTPKAGILIYPESDDLASIIGRKERDDITRIEYNEHKNEVKDGKTFLITEKGKIEVSVFGKHNMLNINAAKSVVTKLGITDEMFYEAIPSFSGASKRLEVIKKGEGSIIFRDFAHAPSKLVATASAVKNQYPNSKLIAVLELHTFSSLNKEFLDQYKETFDAPDLPIVFYSPDTIAQKKLAPITDADIKKAFDNPRLQVFTKPDELEKFLLSQNWSNTNLLLMSSGHFQGMDIRNLALSITAQNV
ncbi:MAG: mpl [Chitinophagaceae bacterium]|nr:mpl [Chitinophagaceae bacterium]